LKKLNHQSPGESNFSASAGFGVVGFDLVLDLLQKEAGKGVEDMTNEEMAQAILAIKRKSVDELIHEGIDRS
jgi:hypothetical protein